jgi:hypothetical protein
VALSPVSKRNRLVLTGRAYGTLLPGWKIGPQGPDMKSGAFRVPGARSQSTVDWRLHFNGIVTNSHRCWRFDTDSIVLAYKWLTFRDVSRVVFFDPLFIQIFALNHLSPNTSSVNNDKLQPVVLHESPTWTLHLPGHPGTLRYLQHYQRNGCHESFLRMRFIRLSTRELQRTRIRSAS